MAWLIESCLNEEERRNPENIKKDIFNCQQEIRAEKSLAIDNIKKILAKVRKEKQNGNWSPEKEANRKKKIANINKGFEYILDKNEEKIKMYEEELKKL